MMRVEPEHPAPSGAPNLQLVAIFVRDGELQTGRRYIADVVDIFEALNVGVNRLGEFVDTDGAELLVVDCHAVKIKGLLFIHRQYP